MKSEIMTNKIFEVTIIVALTDYGDAAPDSAIDTILPCLDDSDLKILNYSEEEMIIIPASILDSCAICETRDQNADIQGEICESCFSKMPEGKWISK